MGTTVDSDEKLFFYFAGTPWCVVWTGDGRVFFFNPSSRTSVWERPADLVGKLFAIFSEIKGDNFLFYLNSQDEQTLTKR